MILRRFRTLPSDVPIWAGPYDGCFLSGVRAQRAPLLLPILPKHDDAGRLVVVPIGSHERHEWSEEGQRYQWTGTHYAGKVDA